MTATQKRLVAAVAKLEALRQRNDAQRAALRRAAGAMADHATGFLEANADKALSDRKALLDHYRALRGRGRGRQLAGETD